MTGANPNILVIVGGVIVAALIGSDVGLALHGTITGTEAIGFLGGFATLAGGIIAHALGVSSGASASTNAVAAAKKP